jgi:hypothetical protein
MGEGKQLALDTDWLTAVLAVVAMGGFALLAGVSAWQVLGGRPWRIQRREASWEIILVAVYGFWIAFGPGPTVPRVMRIFGFLLGADLTIQIAIALAHVIPGTWSGFLLVDARFHLLFWGAACVVMIAWLKRKIRYV